MIDVILVVLYYYCKTNNTTQFNTVIKTMTKWIKIDELVAEHGVTNIVFRVPMQREQFAFGVRYTSSDTPYDTVEAMIDETGRYKVAEGHKVTLRATPEGYGCETYYQMDLESMIRRGIVTYEIVG